MTSFSSFGFESLFLAAADRVVRFLGADDVNFSLLFTALSLVVDDAGDSASPAAEDAAAAETASGESPMDDASSDSNSSSPHYNNWHRLSH